MLALFKRLADAEKVEDSVFKDTLYAKPEGGTVALLGQVCGRQLDTGRVRRCARGATERDQSVKVDVGGEVTPGFYDQLPGRAHRGHGAPSFVSFF